MVTWPRLQYNFVGDIMGRNYDVINFISNTFVLRRPGVAIITMFIKMIFKIPEKLKELEIMH